MTIKNSVWDFVNNHSKNESFHHRWYNPLDQTFDQIVPGSVLNIKKKKVKVDVFNNFFELNMFILFEYVFFSLFLS